MLGTDRPGGGASGIRCRPADLLDQAAVQSLFADGEVQAVVHLGNHSGMHPGIDGRRLLVENLPMNQHVFAEAGARGVSRIVFASSIQTLHGYLQRGSGGREAPSLPLDGDTPARPTNLYAHTETELPGYRVYLPASATRSCGRSVEEVYAAHYADAPCRSPLSSETGFVDIRRIRAETGWEPIRETDAPCPR